MASTTTWKVIQCKSNSIWGRLKGQRYYHRVEHINGENIYTSELTQKENMLRVSENIHRDLLNSVLITL